MEKLPFETTSEIKRYLEDILYLYDEWHEQGSEVFYLIKDEIEEERSTPKRWGNDDKFWKYLIQNKAAIVYENLLPEFIEGVVGKKPKKVEIRIFAIARPHEKGRQVYKYIATSETWQETLDKVSKCATETWNENGEIIKPYKALRVFNVKFIRELLKKIKASELRGAKVKHEPSGVEYLITKDGGGDFFYGVGRKYLRFKKNYPYYKVFVAIFEISNNKKGGRKKDEVYITYDEINEYLKKFYKMSPMGVKDIQNTFNNVIKRKYLPRTPEGREIIETDSEKKGIVFYNPSLE